MAWHTHMKSYTSCKVQPAQDTEAQPSRCAACAAVDPHRAPAGPPDGTSDILRGEMPACASPLAQDVLHNCGSS